MLGAFLAETRADPQAPSRDVRHRGPRHHRQRRNRAIPHGTHAPHASVGSAPTAVISLKLRSQASILIGERGHRTVAAQPANWATRWRLRLAWSWDWTPALVVARPQTTRLSSS